MASSAASLRRRNSGRNGRRRSVGQANDASTPLVLMRLGLESSDLQSNLPLLRNTQVPDHSLQRRCYRNWGRNENEARTRYRLCECKLYDLLQYVSGFLTSASRNAQRSRYGAGTTDNGIDKPAQDRLTSSPSTRRNGTARFVPFPFSLPLLYPPSLPD